jgi:hypothetical protein
MVMNAPSKGYNIQEEDAQIQGDIAVIEHRNSRPELPPIELNLRVLLPHMSKKMCNAFVCTKVPRSAVLTYGYTVFAQVITREGHTFN